MIFNDIGENTINKLKVLQHLEKVYYDKSTKLLHPANMGGECVPIDVVDKKYVLGYYQQYANALRHSTCEDCREAKLMEIEIRFSEMVDRMGERY